MTFTYLRDTEYIKSNALQKHKCILVVISCLFWLRNLNIQQKVSEQTVKIWSKYIESEKTKVELDLQIPSQYKISSDSADARWMGTYSCVCFFFFFFFFFFFVIKVQDICLHQEKTFIYPIIFGGKF